jgi:MOSC domain-containing protein YiiM
MRLRILSVNVARPGIIAVMNGEPVLSAIAKKPLESQQVFVSALGIDGDGQADLTVHGGFDKAVYAYPASHWPWWETQHRLPCRPGTFGENLTLESGDESQIRIGDRFAWGDAELEVAQPRGPCFKLNLHTGHDDAAQIMTLSGRCGFYLRVTREGFAPVSSQSEGGGTVLERSFENHAANVREAFVAVHGKPPVESLEHVMAAPRLAENWHSAVARRLAARKA